MKKILKCTTTLVVSLMMFVSCFSSVSAADINTSIPVQISETETWFFPSEKDYNAYLKQQESTGDIQQCGEYTTTTEISRKNYTHKFVGYHKNTPSWLKTSYYKLTSGTECEVSSSTTYDGISFTLKAKHSTNVEVKLDADSSKYSRLAISGDFLVKHMRTNYYDSTSLYDTFDYISCKRTATYLDVKYK